MDDKTRRTHIKVINSGLERIQDIVKQLLDFSKKTSLSVSPRSINNLIDGVLKLTEYLISEKKLRSLRISLRISLKQCSTRTRWSRYF